MPIYANTNDFVNLCIKYTVHEDVGVLGGQREPFDGKNLRKDLALLSL
jgi:hypothetical protein